MTTLLAPDLAWIDGRFRSGCVIEHDDAGRITDVRTSVRDPLATVRTLEGVALLPGFVNAHSHAFQRGLRGFGESFPAGAGSFWTWREAMYGLVDSLDVEKAYQWSRRAFEEMLAAGMTTVGEFHYIHHESSGAGFHLDDAVVAAAQDTGIRLVLLQAMYVNGGLDEQGNVALLSGGQTRFNTVDLDTYWTQFDSLMAKVDGDRIRLGVVAHSIRAVPPPMIAELKRGANARGCVFHMHVEEQPAEIAACRAAYGRAPMRVLLDEVVVDDHFTAVHCTHTDPADMAAWLDRGGRVCICPLTEANLGDGVADLPAMLTRSDAVNVGSDSNARISMLEELRWLEYVQRVTREKRGVCVDDEGRMAPTLMDIGTINGALALGVNAGRIAAGQLADFALIDLNAPGLIGWTPETLAEALICGGDARAIRGTMVGGRSVFGR